MPVLNIIKQLDNGIVVNDTVKFGSKMDGHKWLEAVNGNPRLDFKVIDWSWKIIEGVGEREILDNPTGGRTGVIPNGFDGVRKQD